MTIKIKGLKTVVLLFCFALLFSCNSASLKINDYISSFPLDSVSFLKTKILKEDLELLSRSKNSNNWKLLKETDYSMTAYNTMDNSDTIHFQIFDSNNGESVELAIKVNTDENQDLFFFSYLSEYKSWFVNQNPFYLQPVKSFLADNAILPETLASDKTLYSYFFKHDTIEIHLHDYLLKIKIESELNVLEDETPRFNKKNYVKYYYDYTWNGKDFTSIQKEWKWYHPVVEIGSYLIEQDSLLGATEEGPGPLYWSCPGGVDLSASSTLNDQGQINYKKENMLDHDNGTAWAEGAEGFGLEERIRFIIRKDGVGETFNFINGYTKNKVTWKNNNRVKLLSCDINTVPHARILLRDTDKLQKFHLFPAWLRSSGTKAGNRIQFYIEEVYAGEKYDDTAISLFMPEGDCY
jgi:hypothetical protein